MPETTTTRSKPEIREEARGRLIALLEDRSPSPFSLLRAELAEIVPDDLEAAARIAEPVSRAASDLVSTRDELSSLMSSVRRTMESTEAFIRGGSARFNSRGILQADGPRIDVLCALFHVHVDRTVEALADSLAEIDRLAVELGSSPEESGCEGHPAGPSDPMGETVYCDGSCRSAS